ncbi:aminoglycoside 6-adenylyltransferase [Sutcliffiella cohnii]
MYSVEERELYFQKLVKQLEVSDLVEGVVQLGSGVKGYRDEFSDVDLMVCTAEEVEQVKDYVLECLGEFNVTYLKAKRHSEQVYIIIAILENGLEFNISTLPTVYLNVRSPLWKVLVDKTGIVLKNMNFEHERFSNRQVKYYVTPDIPFEFVYFMRRLNIELKRNNLIYAMKIIEMLQGFILEVQALNENKKLHQFKAYDTLDPSFIKKYLQTYPNEISSEKIQESANKLKALFLEVIEKSEFARPDEKLMYLLEAGVAR